MTKRKTGKASGKKSAPRNVPTVSEVEAVKAPPSQVGQWGDR